jgi:hypothetical protein
MRERTAANDTRKPRARKGTPFHPRYWIQVREISHETGWHRGLSVPKDGKCAFIFG